MGIIKEAGGREFVTRGGMRSHEKEDSASSRSEHFRQGQRVGKAWLPRAVARSTCIRGWGWGAGQRPRDIGRQRA